MADLVVAGAGMAGLAAAARARELGARVVVLEKGDRPGGSARLSSCVLWRHRDLAAFREECPGGDPALQARVVEELDDALDWLEALGAPVAERETGNPQTIGRRFDPNGLVATLAERAGDVRLGEPLASLPRGVPTILATGGVQGDRALVRRHVTPEADALHLRANPWSAGDGLRLALAAGAATSTGLGEFYGRAMPDTPEPAPSADWVRLAQLYAHVAEVVGADGERYPREAVRWHEADVVQWIARQPRARALYRVPRAALGARIRERSVGDLVEAARAAGAAVADAGDVVEVPVVAAITTTLGGVRVDRDGRALDAAGAPVPGLFAAGTDAGGVFTGGYASGLAAALVLGRAAAEAALASP
ncbi:MAG: FAD-binding protein [Thermoleophilia bacterium]